MAEEIHVGDIGTLFEATIMDGSQVVDISGATTLQIIFLKPNGTRLEKTAALSGDGTDGRMRYVTVAGDLDIAGFWKMQGFVELATWEGHSPIETFQVYDNL